MTESNPVVVACVPAYNEERAIGGVVVRAWFLDRDEALRSPGRRRRVRRVVESKAILADNL